MSLLGSLSAGASGVVSYGRAMTVTGSNIANVNTVGFKAGRVSFEDMLSSDFSQGIGKTKISQGVRIASISADFSQGSFSPTELQTDMAINGNGFFTLKNEFGKEFYTRAGQFTFDKEGNITTERGLPLQVRDIDPVTSEAVGEMHKLKVLGTIDPPLRTGNGVNNSGIKTMTNLDASARVIDVPFDPTNVQQNMYNFSSTVTVFDDLGEEHTATIAYRKRPDIPPQTGPNGQTIPGSKNQWEWYVLFDGGDIGGRPGQMQAVGGGYLQFDDTGRMLQVTQGVFVPQGGGVDPATGQPLPSGPPILQPQPLNPEIGIPQITVDFGASAPQVIGINVGMGSNPDDPTDDRSGLDGVTQFAAPSRVASIEADGHPSGTLEDIAVDTSGIIRGRFDSGFTRALGKVVLTRFDNPDKLTKSGDNLFAVSPLAGRKLIGEAGIGGFGEIRSQTLEQSNVDLAKEFVNMVETQRAFQASAKTVTVSDEMIQDIVGMKR